MKKLSRLWLFQWVVPIVVLGLSAVAVPSRATPALDLATATVAVESQTDAEKARALRAALAQVFVKLSGSRTVLANPAIAAALAEAASYATEVSYVRLPPLPAASTSAAGAAAETVAPETVAPETVAPDEDGADPPAAETTAPAEPRLALTARFEAAALTALLRRADVPTWLNRPELLVVLVVDAPAGQRFATADSDPLVSAATEQAMARRGVVWQLPLLDLEDQTLLSPAEAWALDRDKLGIMAHRYGVSQWLVLRYRDPPDAGWHGFWSLGGEGDPFGRVIVADSLPELVDASVDEAIDRFSPRYARTAKAVAENIDVVIDNVRDFRTFGQVTAALDALQVVTQVDVEGVEGEQLTLRLTLAGEPQDLFDAMARDGHFDLVGTSTANFRASPRANPQVNPPVNPASAAAPPPLDTAAATGTDSGADLPRHWRWRAGP